MPKRIVYCETSNVVRVLKSRILIPSELTLMTLRVNKVLFYTFSTGEMTIQVRCFCSSQDRIVKSMGNALKWPFPIISGIVSGDKFHTYNFIEHRLDESSVDKILSFVEDEIKDERGRLRVERIPLTHMYSCTIQ